MTRSRFAVLWAVLLLLGQGFGCGDDDASSDADVPDVGETDVRETEDGPVEDVGDQPDTDVGEADEVEPDVEADVPETDEGGTDSAFCAAQPDGTSCDDGDLCTVGDQCTSGVCVPGAPPTCNDTETCTDDSCDPATGDCRFVPNTAACDDGDPCTVGDACAGGTCGTGTPRDCTAFDDACNTGECNALTGACFAVPLSDGTLCDDDDACTLGESYTGGTCGTGTDVDCTALDDDCNLGVCDPATGDCTTEPRADDTVCVDGEDCTTGDSCQAGVCEGLIPDGDGDGFGVLGCLTGDDCDDTLWDVNPASVEGPIGRAVCFDRLDNDCDGWTDAADAPCGDGLDWANLDTPTTVAVNVGGTTPLIRGRVFEPGGTEAAGAMTGLTAELGYGPYRTDPTDNTLWTWSTSDYLGQGGPGNLHDVFAGSFTAPVAGQYSYAYRYSLDAGTTWLYADTDGNGAAAPSNGIQVDRLGTLNVIVNDHLLISEVVVVSTAREYVEIYNPTGASVDLATYYLTDGADATLTWRYWDVVQGAGTIRSFDFAIHFPAGATIPVGGRVVIAMGSALTFNTAFARLPDYEMCPGTPDDATVPNMVLAWTGAGCGATPLNNSYETLVLFRWNGTSDLVEDVDIFQWSDALLHREEMVSKTGITRDGPDVGTATSAYLADTPIASQTMLTVAPHSPSGSFERTDMSEVGETQAGGNGITGHDETSEDFMTTWRISTAATPGT